MRNLVIQLFSGHDMVVLHNGVGLAYSRAICVGSRSAPEKVKIQHFSVFGVQEKVTHRLVQKESVGFDVVHDFLVSREHLRKEFETND